ncbi:hypothetical protein T11_7317 [Trichinella zimbabwensis]|uniref:KRAB-A domain-containing protein 2 n=1 Tax=Trichinella zimbabwensis TaxID=268475 RepID=A0A0V1HR39_9BILA|nr:hypothetical protein T11_7317 [Trichinella zimbabwensis]
MLAGAEACHGRWSLGLKFVQWQINVSVHETTGQRPFKVTFGEEPPIGLESYILPKSLDDAAKTEESIERFLSSQEEANKEESLKRHEKKVPDVDRGLADLKNFLVVPMAECKGLYTVVCREGKLPSYLQLLIYITAVTKATGGQGYRKCMCLSGCSFGQCSCSRKRLMQFSLSP